MGIRIKALRLEKIIIRKNYQSIIKSLPLLPLRIPSFLFNKIARLDTKFSGTHQIESLSWMYVPTITIPHRNQLTFQPTNKAIAAVRATSGRSFSTRSEPKLLFGTWASRRCWTVELCNPAHFNKGSWTQTQTASNLEKKKKKKTHRKEGTHSGKNVYHPCGPPLIL